jgi:hypothetical protein
VAGKYIKVDQYKLLVDKKMKDGSVIEKGTLLAKIKEEEDLEGTLLNVETLDGVGFKIKKIFWARKEELKRIGIKRKLIHVMEHKIRNTNINYDWKKNEF